MESLWTFYQIICYTAQEKRKTAHIIPPPPPKNQALSGYSTIQPQKPDEVILNGQKREVKKHSTAKKAGIAAAVAIGLTAVALIARGKLKSAQKLAENIEFSPAKTIEEAKEFAKTHLKIENFDTAGDLEIANWVNEGLTKVSNKYRGKAAIPKTVAPYPEDLHKKALAEGKGVALADINANTGVMRVNIHYFNDAQKDIKKMMEEMGIKIRKTGQNDLEEIKFDILPFMNVQKQLDLIPLLSKINDGTASKMEIVTASRAISDMYEFDILLGEKPDLIYAHVLKSPKLRSIFAQNKDVNVLSMEKFKSLGKNEQIDYLYDLSEAAMKNKKDEDLRNIFSEIRIKDRKPDIFHTIYHETGHSMHAQNLGKKEYNKRHLLTEKEQEIASTISDYAKTNSHEFVAEVHAELMAGNRVSDEIMEIYKKYGGALPVN